MTRHVVPFCSAALAVVLAARLSAQTPTVQNPPVVRPYTKATVMTPAQQIAALQQQVAQLQQTVTQLQQKTQYLSVSNTGFAINAPSVTITGTRINVNGTGGLSLFGNMVQIGQAGGMPAARLGDAVANNAITFGSPTVLIH